ncbi:MAG: GntR family transcriptional regulator [Alphaproteobacteria bacterium]|nr:GntR family transcriptional regulator [Alphaproteobacteria bacterium]
MTSSDNPSKDKVPLATLQERVYRELRESIMLGHFHPGDAMTIRGLAEKLGTSMMPAREALRRLVAERALTLLPNRRVAVPHMTPETFRELTEARVALEVLAARRAFPATDEALAENLAQINAQQDEAIAAGDWAQYQERNRAFHFALYACAPAQVLLPLIESLWLQIGPFLYLTRESLGTTYLEDRHEEAIAAIKGRDEDGLAQAIEQDIRDGMGGLPALLAKRTPAVTGGPV